MNLKAIFIDEISMVGYELFKKLEQRLWEIMGSPKPFGNLHIIAIDDFYQLVPVHDTPLYTLPKKGCNTCNILIPRLLQNIHPHRNHASKRSEILL